MVTSHMCKPVQKADYGTTHYKYCLRLPEHYATRLLSTSFEEEKKLETKDSKNDGSLERAESRTINDSRGCTAMAPSPEKHLSFNSCLLIHVTISSSIELVDCEIVC